MKMTKLTAAAMFAAISMNGIVFAQNRPGAVQPDDPNRPPSSTVRPTDNPGTAGQAAQGQANRQRGELDPQEWARHAAMGNQFEIRVGQLIQERAQDQQLKQYGQQLVQDHQQAQQKLEQAAKARNIQLSSELGPVHQAELAELQKKQGAMFDRAVTYCLIGDHAKGVAAYRDAANELSDPQLKQYAAESLPKLQQHYAMIQRMAGGNMDEARPAGAHESGTSTPHGTPSNQGGSTNTPGSSGTGSGSGGSTGSGSSSGTGSGSSTPGSTGANQPR